MAYYRQLADSAKWLESIQNPDGSFGLVKGGQGTIVNTAEAAYVLRRAGYSRSYHQALKFIQEHWRDHVTTFGPRIRYVAHALYTFAETLDPEFDSDVRACIDWLAENQNPITGAWAADTREIDDCLFSTFLAIWALRRAGHSGPAIAKGQQWFLAQGTESGWRITSGSGPSHVATAYAVIALAGNPNAAARLQSAKSFLLQSTIWSQFEETAGGGSTWKHCTITWMLPALVVLGEPPYAPIIARAVRELNSTRSSDGGWTDGQHNLGKTVRAQFWAAYALSSLQEAFDPEVHIPRIDAERVENAHTEPDFVKFNVQSRWAVVVPSKLYRFVVYLLVLLVVVLTSGIQEGMKVPSWWDEAIVIAAIVAVVILVRKRRAHFRKLSKVTAVLLMIFPALNLILGYSLLDILKMTRALIEIAVASLGLK